MSQRPIPSSLHPFSFPNQTRGKPYMSVLRWRMESGIVGRQAGPLTGAWRVPTQRRCSPSSIYGTLLPGLAAYIACISKRWAMMQKKLAVIYIAILYLFNSNFCQSEPAGFNAPPLIVDILLKKTTDENIAELTSWHPQKDGRKNWRHLRYPESLQTPPAS